MQSFIDGLSKLFDIYNIGYKIVEIDLDELHYIIIPIESEYLYEETIRKPMLLMKVNEFEGALDEFELALDEYRNGPPYDNCIINASKAFESVMKTILSLYGITGHEGDSAKQLVNNIKENTNLINPSLNTYFSSVWNSLEHGPTVIRNLAKVAHGQGMYVQKDLTKSYADFVLNTVGVFIVFLIERYKDSI